MEKNISKSETKSSTKKEEKRKGAEEGITMEEVDKYAPSDEVLHRIYEKHFGKKKK